MRLAQATLLILLVLFSRVLLAQVQNVNPKVNIIGGETYYVHTVLAGQEIEAIAKAYFTDAKSISGANPQVIQGLKPGMELRIPCSLESFDAMSTLKVKEQKTNVQVAESRAPEPKPAPQANRNKKKQVTPIQEALSLIEEPKPEPKPVEKPVVVEQQKPAPEPEQMPVSIPEPEAAPAPVAALVEEPVEELVEVAVQQPEPVKPAESKEPEPAQEPNSIPKNGEEGLENLSQSISESLAALKKIREQLEAPAKEPEVIASDVPVSSRINEMYFLEEVMAEQFAPDSSDTALHLKEYFFVSVDQQGVPRTIEDERTNTNENTQLIALDRLKDIRFAAMQEKGLVGDKEAIGLNLDATKYVYDLKVKKKRIRYYRTSFFVEHMKKDHPHFDLIRKAADSEGKRGKCHVVIYDGSMSETLHKRVEYNPFAEQVQVLQEKRFIEIERIEFEDR